MKTFETRAPTRSAMPTLALLAALALAGCSRGHVGESWQCPLATGGSCGSVAAVDPAVPETSGGTVLDAPLWKPRDNAPGASDAFEGTACTANCGNGSGPFGWLGRLLSDDVNVDRESARDELATAEDDLPGAVIPLAALVQGIGQAGEPASSALPAEPTLAPHDAEAEGEYGDGPNRDGLRTDEVVARIWIAPFVDGNGVYREAGHVRVVLEPASWRTE